MAHRRVDVCALNQDIRTSLQEKGELAKGVDNGELTFATRDGTRAFAPGDRIVFLENNRDLGVKNGVLGIVHQVSADQSGAGSQMIVKLDGRDSSFVTVDMDAYQAIDHGYATTIHKNQGATVDRAFVLASGTMDRHLTYVAMTRHRDSVGLYASREEFGDRNAGVLVVHGVAPYQHKAGNRASYFLTLETAQGQRKTVWGVDLERAMKQAQPAIGQTISLVQDGSTPVRLASGHTIERHSWTVLDAEDGAYRQLESRLSRSGAKETTLDYSQAFAERRGDCADVRH